MRVSLALVALVNAGQAVAWGAAGHEITATIAQMYLLPGVLPRIYDLIYPNATEPFYLAPIATWADRIRWIPGYHWAAPFHYVGGLQDWPPGQCLFGEHGWEGHDGVNVLGGIYNTTNMIREKKYGSWEAAKFLIHFMGDLHQPLHLTARDRGGNGIKVRFHNRLTNLHSVWDGRLISNGILDTPHNYTRPLPSRKVESALKGAIYDPYIRQIVYEGLMGQWKDDLAEWVSCPSSYSTAPEQLAASQQVLGTPPVSTQETPDLGRWDDEFVCPYAWAKPMQEINCNVIWPKIYDHPPKKSGEDEDPIIELDTPEYAGAIRKAGIVENLLARSGVRMAAVLNGLFATEEELRAAGLQGKALDYPAMD